MENTTPSAIARLSSDVAVPAIMFFKREIRAINKNGEENESEKATFVRGHCGCIKTCS